MPSASSKTAGPRQRSAAGSKQPSRGRDRQPGRQHAHREHPGGADQHRQGLFPWRRDHLSGKLVGYYREVAGRMLPYLRERPVSMVCFPDGIEGDRIFQKNIPGYFPAGSAAPRRRSRTASRPRKRVWVT